MTLEEQLAFFDSHAEQAYERTLQIMVEHRPLIMAKARSRLISGFDEYGEGSWNKQANELLNETLQELADAPVYQVMQMRREELGPDTNEPDAWDEYIEEDAPAIVFEADPRLVRILNDEDGPDD